MADVKWSSFPSTTATASGDTLVGLHSGANEQFVVSSTPSASGVVIWDANSNLSGNNVLGGWQSIATAAANTTLTVASPFITQFTGTTTQSCIMPVTSTLKAGQPYLIINASTGVVTVKSSGSNTIQAMASGTSLWLVCDLITGTTAASWQIISYATSEATYPLSLALGGTNAALTATAGAVTYSSSTALALTAAGSANQLLASNGTSAPSWTTNTFPTTDAKGDILYASAANTISGLAIGSTGNILTVAAGLPAWTTATYPATTTINQILYSSATNTVTGLATVAAGVLTTSSSVPTWASQLPLSLGGTNASLTASNGGIFYSTASAGAILAGTATANQLLLSGASGAPSWSTSTYPTTNAANTLLYASSANTMAALTTANDCVLITSNSGVPSWLANSATPGYVLTANSGAPPSWQAAGGGGSLTFDGDSGSATPSASTITISGGSTGLTTSGTAATISLTGTLNVGHGGLGITTTPSNGFLPIGNGTNYTAAALTAGTGISITNGSGTITIASSGSSGWVDQTTSSVTMAINTGYTSDDGATLVTFTLPATASIGDFVEINGKGSGLYTIAQAAGQIIHFGNLASTSGTGGSVSSTLQYDCIKLRCITANTTWVVVSSIGNFTVV